MGSYIAILIVGFLWLLTFKTDESDPFYKRLYSLTGTFILFCIFTWFIVTWCSEIISTPDHWTNEYNITSFQKEDSSFVIEYGGRSDRFELDDSNLKVELDTFHQQIRIKDYQQFTKWYLYGPRPVITSTSRSESWRYEAYTVVLYFDSNGTVYDWINY